MYIDGDKVDGSFIKSKDGEATVFEYGTIDPGLDLGIAKIVGKYPGEDMFARNREVLTMTYFVISGNGIFRFEDGEEHEIKKGDCVFIGRGRGYQLEVSDESEMEVLMASNPVWTPDQYEIYKK